jgi:hypothetical protein
MAFDELRKPFLILALVCIAVVVLIEAGYGALLSSHLLKLPDDHAPGLAISYLAVIDGLLLYSLILMTIAFFSREFAGRAQGIAGLIVSVVGLLGLIAMLFAAIALLMVMVSLLLAIPFGTIAYLVIFGHFARGLANSFLALIMTLKIATGVCLLLAQQAFLKNKSLVILFLLSIVCSLLISFLHAFPPGILVSITDALAAIIIAVLAMIWLIILLLGSIMAVIKAVV